METVFTKLIDEFIDGKLSRRGLIQSLAVASAVAFSPKGASAAAGPRQLKATAINHVSYQCMDYARTRDFYVKNFGMKAAHDNGKQCYLMFGDNSLLVRNAAAGGKAPPFIDHIAFTIKDYGPNSMDAAAFKADNASVGAALEALGNKVKPDTELSWMVTDPDGFNVQVSPELMHPGNPVFDEERARVGAFPPRK